MVIDKDRANLVAALLQKHGFATVLAIAMLYFGLTVHQWNVAFIEKAMLKQDESVAQTRELVKQGHVVIENNTKVIERQAAQSAQTNERLNAIERTLDYKHRPVIGDKQ